MRPVPTASLGGLRCEPAMWMLKRLFATQGWNPTAGVFAACSPLNLSAPPLPSTPTWEITADFSRDSLSPLYQWMNAYNGWIGVREKKNTQNHLRLRLFEQFFCQFLWLVDALMNNKDLERLRETAELKRKKERKTVGRIIFMLVELVQLSIPLFQSLSDCCFGPLFFFNHRIKSSIRGAVLIRCRSSTHYPPPSQLACFCPTLIPTSVYFIHRYTLIVEKPQDLCGNATQ